MVSQLSVIILLAVNQLYGILPAGFIFYVAMEKPLRGQ
jgi:hypothetical protein